MRCSALRRIKCEVFASTKDVPYTAKETAWKPILLPCSDVRGHKDDNARQHLLSNLRLCRDRTCLSCFDLKMASMAEKLPDDAHIREPVDVSSDKASSDDLFEITWTEQEEKRVRNKLDWQIVCRFLVYDQYDNLADQALPRYPW